MDRFEFINIDYNTNDDLRELVQTLISKPTLTEHEQKTLLYYFTVGADQNKRYPEKSAFHTFIEGLLHSPPPEISDLQKHLEDRLLFVLGEMSKIDYPYMPLVVHRFLPVAHLIGRKLSVKSLALWKKHHRKIGPDFAQADAFDMILEATPETDIHNYASKFLSTSIAGMRDEKRRGNRYRHYAEQTIKAGLARLPLEKHFVDLWVATVNGNPALDYVDRANEGWFYARNEEYNGTFLGDAALNLAKENGLPIIGNNLNRPYFEHIEALYCLGRQRTSAQQPPGPPPANIMDHTITAEEAGILCSKKNAPDVPGEPAIGTGNLLTSHKL